ncbi:hypothetical protein D3C77_620460 [compost metagenome]
MATKLIQLNLSLAPNAVVGLGNGSNANLMVEVDLSGKPIGDYSIKEIEELARAELKRVAATA